jgi:hypothetical protein
VINRQAVRFYDRAQPERGPPHRDFQIIYILSGVFQGVIDFVNRGVIFCKMNDIVFPFSSVHHFNANFMIFNNQINLHY